MNCNEKGSRGLIKVVDDLQMQGFFVFLAFDDHSPIDLIAVDKGGRSYRLQIKYRTRIPDRPKNRYSLPTQSVINGKRISIDRSLIDGWAVYMADDNKVTYISKNFMEGKTDISLDPEKYYGDLKDWKCAREA